ncbi:MAG: type II secretion system protein [Phycisphaerales bacterium]|nr:MAG: type II secretion system protein [Phycisphaerales bacterium]
MTCRPPRTLRRGFTLVEMVISTGLLVMLISTLYWFYGSSLTSRKDGTDRARRMQLARVVLDGIAEEIRLCTGNTEGYGAGLIGTENALSVYTLTLPTKELMRRRSITEKALAGQFDLQEVRHYIAWDEENLDENGDPRPLGLVRRVTHTFNQAVVIEGDEGADETVAIKEELYAPEIKFLEFRYFDGATWWDTWEIGGGNSLPQMVRITVGYTAVLPDEYSDLEVIDEEENLDEYELRKLFEDRYTVIVRLVQADRFFGSRISREASAFTESQEEL